MPTQHPVATKIRLVARTCFGFSIISNDNDIVVMKTDHLQGYVSRRLPHKQTKLETWRKRTLNVNCLLGPCDINADARQRVPLTRLCSTVFMGMGVPFLTLSSLDCRRPASDESTTLPTSLPSFCGVRTVGEALVVLNAPVLVSLVPGFPRKIRCSCSTEDTGGTVCGTFRPCSPGRGYSTL